jgi:hypothetical protein
MRHPWAIPYRRKRDLAAARKIERRAEIDRAIAEGRLIVRRMTAEEREQSATRRAAGKAPAGRRTRCCASRSAAGRLVARVRRPGHRHVDGGKRRLPLTRFRSGRNIADAPEQDPSPGQTDVSRHGRRNAPRRSPVAWAQQKLARQSPIKSMVDFTAGPAANNLGRSV